MDAPREWLDTDYYAVLGVSETASAKEITKAYRTLARELHPDTNPGDAAAEERFKRVSSAYDVIGDNDKRVRYDQVRQEMRAASSATATGWSSAGGGFNGADLGGFGSMGDIDDLFSMFTRPRGPRRGRDVRAQARVSFRDAVFGSRLSMEISEPVACGACGATGTSGTAMCGTCGGSGVLNRTRPVTFSVPAGVEDGATLRVGGHGLTGDLGAPAGDLLVDITVEPDPVFTRTGLDVHVCVPVTFAEAVLGADITAPCADGTTVTLRMKPGTQAGTSLRAKGRGITAGVKKGDLLVQVRVEVPTDLSDDMRALVEQLAAGLGEPRRGPASRWARNKKRVR